MTAPTPRALARDDDRLVEEVARALSAETNGKGHWRYMREIHREGWRQDARAAIAVCRAHFAALSRQHGAAIRGRIDMGDGPATVERFEQRALVAHEIATLIEGEK